MTPYEATEICDYPDYSTRLKNDKYSEKAIQLSFARKQC